LVLKANRVTIALLLATGVKKIRFVEVSSASLSKSKPIKLFEKGKQIMLLADKIIINKNEFTGEQHV